MIAIIFADYQKKINMQILRKILLAILVAISFLSANAQISYIGYKSEKYDLLKASTTYVVLTGDKTYDDNMKSALEENWKISKYEFINEETLKEKISDKAATFLISATIFTSTSGQSWHFIMLVNGGRKNLNRYDLPDLLSCGIINHYGNEGNTLNAAPRLRNIIASMVKAMDIIKKEELGGMPNNTLLDYYRTKSPMIAKRTLLVNKSAMGSKFSEEDFTKIYRYKYEFCTQEKIDKAIKDKSTEYYYLQPAITLSKNIFVFDPSNGDVVYGERQIMGMNINSGNIKDLMKAIDKQ